MRRRRSLEQTRECPGLGERGCGEPLGPVAELCPKCRKRRRRREKAGLPASALPEGGRRGRLRLGQLTAGERRLRRELEQALELARNESFREGYDAGVEAAMEKARPIIRRLKRELEERLVDHAPEPPGRL